MKNLDHSSSVISELLELIRQAGEIREWTYLAECQYHPSVDFFPNFPITRGGHIGVNTIAKQRDIAARAILVCMRCPVIDECKKDHLHEPEGVFFGTTPYERLGPSRRGFDWQHCNCIPCKTKRAGNRNFGGQNA